MLADPESAPPRPDLGFLRRRSRPAPPSGLADFLSGRTTQSRPRSAPLAPAPPPPAPAPPPPAPARPAPAAPSTAPVSGDLLDLSPTAAAAAPPTPPTATPSGAPSAAARPTARPALTVHRDARIAAGEQRLLSVTHPTVTLTRVQSGVGQLQIEAVCGPQLAELRLGAAYQLRGGASSTVQYAGGNRFAPSSRRPVIVAGRDEYEHLRVDLRQCRELERMAVYAFAESGAQLSWGGTLVVTTFGGAHLELPLETLYPGRVAVLLSIYNVAGEFVVRAEMETISGDVREAARAYGYDRITWRDERTPVD
jgi:uncharacterized protein involved in tellurium resistance